MCFNGTPGRSLPSHRTAEKMRVDCQRRFRLLVDPLRSVGTVRNRNNIADSIQVHLFIWFSTEEYSLSV